jgi:3-hydroxyacyl-[acyl-carrier-protein] dehydratase
VTAALPFAAPLRAIDRAECTQAGDRLVIHARKTIVATDPYLGGHFPGFMVFPGVFVIEALRQAVAAALGESDGMVPEIHALRSVRFLAPLRPGDELMVEATLGPVVAGQAFDVTARCRRGDGVTVARIVAAFGYGSPGDA